MSPLILLLAAMLTMSIILVFIGLASSGKSEVEARLFEYGGMVRRMTLEEIELSQPFSQRIVLPLIKSAARFAAYFTPKHMLERTRHKLDLAGNPGNWSASEFWGIRGLGCILLGILAFLLFTLFKVPTPKRLFMGAIVGMLGFYLPIVWLGSKIRRRRAEIIKSLPDALDLLTICVEAGLGFDAAMLKVTEKWENEISRAFGRVLQEIRVGKLRREALRGMAERIDLPDVTSFVAAIIQADQLGVSISKVMRIQSEQMRIRRRQRAEEKAHQAPIKMLFPMIFLIFPSLFVVLLGPAIIRVLKSEALRAVLNIR
jgi:tight adherence protein C